MKDEKWHQAEFERRLKRRVWQMRRSKLLRKQIAEEYGNKPMTKEEAQKYIEEVVPALAKQEYLNSKGL